MSIMFRPSDYQDLTPSERALLELAFRQAVDALRRNVTPRGFSACSLADNRVHGTDVNYRSIWSRDASMTTIWTLFLDDPQIRQCQKATLETLFRHQLPSGLIPTNVLIETDVPEYSGVGGIAGLDGIMWTIIAAWRFATTLDEWEFIANYFPAIDRAMTWLRAHDSNNCGLIEIPEASDWTDLFARSYHVLYDEVLWYRCTYCYAKILRHVERHEEAYEWEELSQRIRRLIVKNFWPSTMAENVLGGPQFTETQYSLGDSRYLVAQLAPFSFSWRCDVVGNLLAFLHEVVDAERAIMTFRFLWGVGINDPGPVRNLYPPVAAGDPEWRNYFTVNLLNLPNHYHNGGIWPFIGGMWVRYLNRLGMRELARRELVKLAELCSVGVTHEWEFNEWHHGVTGRPMGKAFQAWSAASFLYACRDVQLDPHDLSTDD